VDLQVGGVRIGKKSLEQHRSLDAFTDFGIDHRVPRVESAHRQKARCKDFRDGVNRLKSLISDLAHVYGMARAIGRICRLVLKIDKKKFLTKFRVLHAHAAWQAWIVSDNATSPQRIELRFLHGEERPERIRR